MSSTHASRKCGSAKTSNLRTPSFAQLILTPVHGIPDSPPNQRRNEGELNGNIVFVCRAGHDGKTMVVYALTKDERPKALQARYLKITVF